MNRTEEKVVKQEYVDDPRQAGKKVWVSTVRLVVDHGFDGRPLWYETYIFPADDEGTEVASWGEDWGTRYETRDQAQEGHESIVNQLKRGDWPA